MSSAFISNNASNGPITFLGGEIARTFAATKELTEKPFKFEAAFSEKLGFWRIAKQDENGNFIEWVED